MESNELLELRQNTNILFKSVRRFNLRLNRLNLDKTQIKTEIEEIKQIIDKLEAQIKGCR